MKMMAYDSKPYCSNYHINILNGVIITTLTIITKAAIKIAYITYAYKQSSSILQKINFPRRKYGQVDVLKI